MIQALRSLMLLLPAAPGFISCRLCQDTDDANAICYAEEWHTPEDLDRQIRSSHYTGCWRSWRRRRSHPSFG